MGLMRGQNGKGQNKPTTTKPKLILWVIKHSENKDKENVKDGGEVLTHVENFFCGGVCVLFFFFIYLLFYFFFPNRQQRFFLKTQLRKQDNYQVRKSSEKVNTIYTYNTTV